MNTSRKMFAAFFAAVGFSAAAFAADLSGTWKWTSATATGPVEISAVIMQKEGVITGTVTTRQGPADINHASLQDGQVSFSVTRGTAENQVVIKYAGKVDGDTITGKIERPGPKGVPTTTEWKAKRVP